MIAQQTEKGLTPKIIYKLHEFLHTGNVGDKLHLIIGDIRNHSSKNKVEIMRHTEGVKYLICMGTELKQQKPNSGSVYGMLAFTHKISWGPRSHIKVVDDVVYYKGLQVYPKLPE